VCPSGEQVFQNGEKAQQSAELGPERAQKCQNPERLLVLRYSKVNESESLGVLATVPRHIAASLVCRDVPWKATGQAYILFPRLLMHWAWAHGETRRRSWLVVGYG